MGVQGLTDRSRRPYRHPNQLPMAIEKTIVRLKRDYPSWGAPKIHPEKSRSLKANGGGSGSMAEA